MAITLEMNGGKAFQIINKRDALRRVYGSTSTVSHKSDRVGGPQQNNFIEPARCFEIADVSPDAGDERGRKGHRRVQEVGGAGFGRVQEVLRGLGGCNRCCGVWEGAGGVAGFRRGT